MPRSTRAASHASDLSTAGLAGAAATRPPLPDSGNEMILPDRAPSHEILVQRRCLGQTELKVKAGLVGTSNATKQDNLGVLDYAHLRVPLPSNLEGSYVFSKTKRGTWPESYFLMRRSSDGYVSATGMFKAAFPRATEDEEDQEKEYLKSMSDAAQEEVAGNIWIAPEAAVELAKEYGIEIFIAALLSPIPITHGTSDPQKYIQSPPPFIMKEDLASLGRTPEKKAAAAEGRRSTRGVRSLRSASPTKTPSRRIATPRKPRKGKGALASVDEADLRASLEPDTSVNGDADQDTKHDVVRVEIETETVPSPDGLGEVENTKVNIEMPAGSAELDLPTDPQAMIEQARKMVHEAERINSGGSNAQGKRKAAEMLEDDESDEAALEVAQRAPKRLRAAELELRKEKIKKRALMGTAATIALGALLPSILAAFGAA